jgi:nucleoside-diphosphate-sugar epimerase
MKILIIGGSGHVSGAVARAAVAGGHDVSAITRGQRSSIDGVTFLVADRQDNAAMEKVVTEQNTVWDLVVDCICFEVADIQQNIALFRERAKQFVLVSTDAVYDPPNRQFLQPEDADSWAGAHTVYGQKKRYCEEGLINGDTGDMKWTILRPGHLYGPTSELGCLPPHLRDTKLIEKMQNGETLRLPGGGHFLQQPINVDEFADIVISVAGNSKAHNTVFNTAGPDIIESWRYYQIVADLLGVELKVEDVPVAQYRDENPEMGYFLCHRIYDLARLKASGLSVPSMPIEDGLRPHVEGLLAR